MKDTNERTRIMASLNDLENLLTKDMDEIAEVESSQHEKSRTTITNQSCTVGITDSRLSTKALTLEKGNFDEAARPSKGSGNKRQRHQQVFRDDWLKDPEFKLGLRIGSIIRKACPRLFALLVHRIYLLRRMTEANIVREKSTEMPLKI